MLGQLERQIHNSTACINPFFESAKEKGWTKQQLNLFAPDYYAWVESFPRTLASLVAHAPTDTIRRHLTEILFQELGEQNEEKMHYKLLRSLLFRLGVKVSSLDQAPKYDETVALINGMSELYSDPTIGKALGAQFALECQATVMTENLLQGFRKFSELEQKDFEYFDLHIIAEPQHYRIMQRCVQPLMNTPGFVSGFNIGALTLVEMIGNFWARLHKKVCLPQ